MAATILGAQAPLDHSAETRAAGLADRVGDVRRLSEALIASLTPEDCAAQSMPDTSPAKWHLAHTSWYFETFVLERLEPGFTPYHPDFRYLFNSYYQAVGPQYARPHRGLLTRPSLAEVLAYRTAVTERLLAVLAGATPPADGLDLVELGIHHEQQHQELLLMDAKHLLACNPMAPAYRDDLQQDPTPAAPAGWRAFDAVEATFGDAGDGFAFDNEGPRHRATLAAFDLASRPVTNAEYLEFMDAGGYQTPTLWLSDGWAAVQADAWRQPCYWRDGDDGWYEFTLGGKRPLDPHAPVSHLSYYEADAFATWAGARLPTEYEWEHAVASAPVRGNLLATDRLQPGGPTAAGPLARVYGDVWEWTRSAYAPYPGFRPPAGAVGEYNGKFMCNQMVLRGGCCLTPPGHLRATYRNFYYPHTRWHCSGLRLARDRG